MDAIAETVQREIALDCSMGTTLDTVWEYVAQAQQHQLAQTGKAVGSVAADRALQEYLWPVIARMQHMTFLHDDQTVYSSETTSGDAGFLALTLAQVQKKYPRLRVRASRELSFRWAFGRSEGNSKVMGSEMALKTFETLSRARAKGLTQQELAKAVGVDPRQVFHYIKLLDTQGLVVKETTYTMGRHTNLIRLRIFADADKPEEETKEEEKEESDGEADSDKEHEKLLARLAKRGVRRMITDVLGRAESGLMVENDVMAAMDIDWFDRRQRRFFHRAIREMMEGGFIEIMKVKMRDTDGADGAGEEDGDDTGEEDGDQNGDQGQSQTQEQDQSQTQDQSQDQNNDQTLVQSQSPTASRKRRRTEQNGAGDSSSDEQAVRRVARPTKRLASGYTYRRCLRLVKAYNKKLAPRQRVGIRQSDASENDSGSSSSDENTSGDESDTAAADAPPKGKEREEIAYLQSVGGGRVGSGCAVALEAQVFRLIALSGSHGTVARAIQWMVGGVTVKTLSRMLTRLEKSPVLEDGRLAGVMMEKESGDAGMLISSVDEFVGRERRKRYYANARARVAIATLEAAGVEAAAAAATTAGAETEADVETTTAPAAETVAAPTETVAEETTQDTPSIDMAALVADAAARHVSVNQAVREHVLAAILANERVISCGQTWVGRVDNAVRQFFERHQTAAGVTQAHVAAAQKHELDRRTLLRTLSNMAQRGLVQLRTISGLVAHGAGQRATEQLAIAKDEDADGALVRAFIAELTDRRALRQNSVLTYPRLMPDADGRLARAVCRTPGAAERDARWRASMQHARAQRRPQDAPASDAWLAVAHRLRAAYRMQRLVELHAFVATHVKTSDGTEVLENGAFRASVFFAHMPLELFLRMCGGLSSFPAAQPFIRYGSDCDAGSDAEEEVDESLAAIERRLATPLAQLPPILNRKVAARAPRTRMLLQQYISALCVLRLMYPVDTVARAALTFSGPPDARSLPPLTAERAAPVSPWYQVVGTLRLLTRASAIDGRASVDFADARTFDAFSADGRRAYWAAIERLHCGQMPRLTSAHVLYGIDQPRCWQRRVAVAPDAARELAQQAETLGVAALLEAGDALQAAAQAAGVSEDVALHYVRNLHCRQAALANRKEGERRRHIAKRIRRAKARALLPKPAKPVQQPGRARRRPWTESESSTVAVAYAILRHHARTHHHPFLLHNLSILFPARAHVLRPSESIRNRWMRMTRDPAYAAMAAALLALWPFVLRDAVEAGVLRDEPDLRDFDLAAAANHFRATLRAHPLDALQTRYAADLDAQLPPGVHAVTDSGDIAPMEFRKDAPTAPPVSLRPPRTFRYRLPDTMYGNEYRYSIAHVPRERRRGMAYADAEFAEDSVVAQVPARVRKRAAYAGMLTVRAPGAGNPIALRIDGLEDAPEDPLVPVPPRADAMAAELPLRRTVDLERLERLLVDESEDVEDTATDDENPEARYAHVASMQALAIDLALSPPERYDATLGHALLSARESAATRALDALARHGVLGLSSGASARDAVGLGMVASDRFLLAVRARPLPQGFLDHPVWRAATGVLPLDALQAGELAHVCRLVGQSRLWLRPLFAEDCTHGLDALAGFRKQQVGGLLHFDIAVVYAKPDETDQETKVDQVVDEEDIKLVCRVADVMGPLGVSSAELAAICHALSFTRGIARAASFATAPQAAAVLRRLVTGNRLHSVGSTDERFVTPAIFHQHWCVHLPSPTGSRTYPPYIGHSRSPKVLSYVRTLTLGVLAWVREWPGVTARVLVRRRYAPVVCRADVERALDSLVRLQVIVRWWDEDMQEFAYRIASGYHYRLKALDECVN